MSTTVRALPGFVKSPIDIPATGFLMGTPASIRASVLTQMLAIEEEPLDPIISDTHRMV